MSTHARTRASMQPAYGTVAAGGDATACTFIAPVLLPVGQADSTLGTGHSGCLQVSLCMPVRHGG